MDLSNNSPFPSDFNVDHVKIEQGIATASQGVFRVTLLEYPHVVNLEFNDRAAVIRCRVEPGEAFLGSQRYRRIPSEDTPEAAQYYNVFIAPKEYSDAVNIIGTFLTGQLGSGIAVRQLTVVPVARYEADAPFAPGPFGLSISSGQSDIDEIEYDQYEYRMAVYVPKQNIFPRAT